MTITSTTSTSDGATATFSIPFPFFSRAHVEVLVDGAAYGGAVTWISDSSISLSPIPASGVKVTRRRVTPDTPAKSTFTNSNIAATGLNANQTQALYHAQEKETDLSRTLRVPHGESGLTLDPAADRAGMIQEYDEGGASRTDRGFDEMVTAAAAVVGAAALAQIAAAGDAEELNVTNAGTEQIGLVEDAGDLILAPETGTLAVAEEAVVGEGGTIEVREEEALDAIDAQATAQVVTIAQAFDARDYPTNGKALSNGLAAVTITAAGTGGTPGTYSWTTTGGSGTNASGYLVIEAGGTISSVVVEERGYDYASAPTIVIAGTPGVTGHTLTPSLVINQPVGSFWRIKVTDGWEVFENVAGTATSRGTYADKPLVDAAAVRVITSSSRNKFNKDGLLSGYALVDGVVAAYPPDGEANPYYATIASQLSNLIPTAGQPAITISGLPANTANGNNYDRPYVWLAADGITVVDTGYLPTAAERITLSNSARAPFFRFVFSQRSGTGLSAADVQVEYGFDATPYTAFVADTVASIGGKLLLPTAVPVVEYVGADEQLFNSAVVVEGHEVYADGRLIAQADSSYILIYVGHLQGLDIAISGLQTPDVSPRYYSFYDAKPSTADPDAALAATISGGSFSTGVAGGVLTVPANALWMALSPRQRNTDAADYANVVVCVGETPGVGPVAYTPRVALIDGVPLAGASGAAAASDYTGTYLGFIGNSNTQTNTGNVEASPSANFEVSSGTRENWPTETLLKMPGAIGYNVAEGGASWGDWDDATHFQMIKNQVTKLIAIADDLGIDFSIIFMGGGTNDDASSRNPPAGYGGLGDVATAAGKAFKFNADGSYTTDLLTSVALESIRLQVLRLRRRFPNAYLVYVTAIQRGDFTPQSSQAWIDAQIEMAGLMGCDVADNFRRSGITHEMNGSTATGSIGGTTLTVAEHLSGLPLRVGHRIKGGTVTSSPSATVITALGTGTGGAGTYTVNNSQTVASATLMFLGGADMPDEDGIHAGTSNSGRRKMAKEPTRMAIARLAV